MNATSKIEKIQNEVLRWYDINKRDLPWRKTTDPYKILLSEIMLQQTQVPRVIEKYNQFLAKYPTVNDFANAPTSHILALWSGLGYNRRALNLQKAIQTINTDYKGIVPDNLIELQKLKGIGPYTASAILSFAFNKDVVVLDINIKRIYSRFLGTTNVKQIEKFAEEIIPKEQSRNWHNALMDIGTIHCRPLPTCTNCPFSHSCKWKTDNSRIEILAGKQSTFLGSPRYYRGTILKELTKQKQAEKNLLGLFPLKLQKKRKVEEALNALEKEGFITKEEKKWKIKE